MQTEEEQTEFTDEELDAYEAELTGSQPEAASESEDDKTNDEESEPEAQQQEQIDEGEDNSQGEEATLETEEKSEQEEDFLDKYLRENPLEAKSKSARVQIDSRAKMQESINKSLDYHKKTMELSGWRENIGIMESGEITKDDLIQLAEFKRGNTNAFAKMAQDNKVDVYDLDDNAAENYSQQHEYMSEAQIEMQSVAQELLSDEVVAPAMERMSADMPDDFREALSTNPQVLNGFAQDIRSGAAEKIYPHALAAQAMQGGDFITHYQNIGQQMFAQQRQAPAAQQSSQAQEQPTGEQHQVSDRERDLRNKASISRGSQGKPKTFLEDANSIWDMSDEEFAKIGNNDISNLR